MNKEGLQRDENLEGLAIRRDRSSKGRSFHAYGTTAEKALRCIVAKRAQGTKSSPLAAEYSTRRSDIRQYLPMVNRDLENLSSE